MESSTKQQESKKEFKNMHFELKLTAQNKTKAGIKNHNLLTLSKEFLKTTIFRQETFSSAEVGFHVGPLSRSNWNLEMLVFVEEEKPENPRKTTPAISENKQTRSIHLWFQARVKLSRNR